MLMFVTRSLHSLRDMKTPVKWGAICLVVNLVGCLILKEIWGTLGLAVANVGSTGLMALGLRWELSRKEGEKLQADWGLVRLGIAVAAMAGLVGVIVTMLPSGKLGSVLKIVFGGGVGLVAYLTVLYFIHRGALKSLWRVVAR
jgi:peptidoglycan biosynthesis protein MviN/MurJ (putative lipid II flippase)